MIAEDNYMLNVIKKKFEEKLAEKEQVSNSIIVLKGISLKMLFPEYIEKVDLEDLATNRILYFSKLITDRKVVTYEEFLLLYDFIVAQYSEVYIFENNIYMDQYSVELLCSEEIRKGLLNHFMEVEDDENDDLEVGKGAVQELISLYIGVKDYNGLLIGAYNDSKVNNSSKVEVIRIFEESRFKLRSTYTANTFIDIIEEADYIELVSEIFGAANELCIRISNYTGDLHKLNQHLQIVAENWAEQVTLSILQPQIGTIEFEHKAEYTDILKKHWGFDSFRSLPVYDMAKLEEHQKEVTNISQEKIISDIVKQVENCGNPNADSKDVFVTAPTGAGKSVMFQIPAIYLAEKYNLLTIVISPLIGLMNDQIKNLELKNYRNAKTINSDISPIIKQEIMEKVASSEYHILYLSPETLLARSDVEQLIGDRTIGMIVIDEAHIVTTWGKQFRPDYWYLGDHIRKLRKRQIDRKGRSFVIATFTATAIYKGVEDMYTETINSLHMINPITYLGYVKRNDIDIVIQRSQKDRSVRREYEPDKFLEIENVIMRAMITNKKTLVYFPTVALINRCYEYLRAKRMISQVAIYHGSLNKDQKTENYEQFMRKEKLVMLATKAFGMGIDIDDIEIVVHFAPTGNVCDYVQEIGRAARNPSLRGEAFYAYEPRDFKHINRLHGLSTIQKYQLIEVIKKIDEIYSNSLKSSGRQLSTRKRNALLLDAENFTYIFGSPIDDDDNNINKVKTALLIIQKDFENKFGFSPVTIRPIPLFSVGFFEIQPQIQANLLEKYNDCLEEIEPKKHICRVMLEKIWRKDYANRSLPQFKYLLYTRDEELDLVKSFPMRAALCVNIEYASDYFSVFNKYWTVIQKFINDKVRSEKYTSQEEIVDVLKVECGISKYKAQSICEVLIASMNSYRRNFMKGMSAISTEKTMKDNTTKYQFHVAVGSYFNWVNRIFHRIINDTDKGELYIINDGSSLAKETGIVLGILESLDVLTFKMIGGANSQLYIYINQIQTLKNIISYPKSYNNKLLSSVSERHLISVKMLTYLYENGFTSDDMWNILEDYFLGKIPETVIQACRDVNPNMVFE